MTDENNGELDRKLHDKANMLKAGGTVLEISIAESALAVLKLMKRFVPVCVEIPRFIPELAPVEVSGDGAPKCMDQATPSAFGEQHNLRMSGRAWRGISSKVVGREVKEHKRRNID
ncbi:hypothetical protein HOY80DRAFT_1102925 [Tuber brumale]|nr:hypothetical protein HOY80DRAFT_1102925 [Tuber brumale]